MEFDLSKSFVFLKRECENILFFTGEQLFLDKIKDIPISKSGKDLFDVFFALPFCQIKEKGFDFGVDNKNKISCLKIKNVEEIYKSDFLREFSFCENIDLEEKISFDLTKTEYEKIVKKIIKDEIGEGEGANFVIARNGKAKIKNMSHKIAITIFKNFLDETGSHWPFLFFDGEKYLMGISPEAHIVVDGENVEMNPISGTFRKDENFTYKNFLKFLGNEKEINELFMVVDEELKMMSNICEKGGVIVGPLLKEMSYLFHTEYLLKGKSKKNILDILQKSMFAATVTGSPIKNACRIIKKYEKKNRGFYSSCVALAGKNEDGKDFLDSSILIRSSEIDKKGNAKFSVGASLVRNSLSHEEALETDAKIAGIIRSFENKKNEGLISYLDCLEKNDKAYKILEKRNKHLSKFWFLSQEKKQKKSLQITIIDNEDDFSFMLKHIFECIGFTVSIISYKNYVCKKDKSDLTIIGPGPGNPLNKKDDKIKKINEVLGELLKENKKIFAVCLGHQILCNKFGIKIEKKDKPLQGIQKEIDFFGKWSAISYRIDTHRKCC